MNYELQLNGSYPGDALECLDRLKEAIGSRTAALIHAENTVEERRSIAFTINGFPSYPLTRVVGELRQNSGGVDCRATITPVQPIARLLELIYLKIVIFFTIFFVVITLFAVWIGLFQSAEFGHWGIFVYLLPLLYLASAILSWQNRRLQRKLERILTAGPPLDTT